MYQTTGHIPSIILILIQKKKRVGVQGTYKSYQTRSIEHSIWFTKAAISCQYNSRLEAIQSSAKRECHINNQITEKQYKI